jgi:hypothetical protein
MFSSYNIVYRQPESGDPVYGLALPVFINNGTYFLDTLDMYEDGVAECWGLVRIDELQEKVDSGWITTAPPVGAKISVHALGGGTLSAVERRHPDAYPVEKGQAFLKGQNFLRLVDPNLLPNGGQPPPPPFDFDARRKQLAAEWGIPESQVALSRMRQNKGVYGRSKGGAEITGATFPLFWYTVSDIVLTDCVVYADGRLSVGHGTTLYTVDEFQTIFDSDRIRTAVEDDVWFKLKGLGYFQVTDGYWYVEKEELWKNILNSLNVLRGGNPM